MKKEIYKTEEIKIAKGSLENYNLCDLYEITGGYKLAGDLNGHMIIKFRKGTKYIYATGYFCTDDYKEFFDRFNAGIRCILSNLFLWKTGTVKEIYC